MPAASPDALRAAIAAQRTVPHSIAALLRAVCSQIYAAVDADDIALAAALADSIEADPAGWALAVTANTPQAAETAAVEIDLDHVTGVEHALGPLGHRAERKAEEAETAKAEAAKREADQKAAEESAWAAKTAAENAARDQAAASVRTGAVAGRPQADSDRGTITRAEPNAPR